MKKLIPFFVTLFLLVTTGFGYAFTLSEESTKWLQVIKKDMDNFNKYLIDLKNEFITSDRVNPFYDYCLSPKADREFCLMQRGVSPSYAHSHNETKLKIYKQAYGPEFELAIDTGTGRSPLSYPNGIKDIWYFAGWKANRYQVLRPEGVTEDFQFDPDFTVVNCKFTGPAGKIVVMFYPQEKRAQIIDVDLPYVASHLGWSQSQYKGNSVAQNILIPLMDKYFTLYEKAVSIPGVAQAYKKDRAIFGTMLSVVLGNENDEILQFAKNNLKTKGKIKTKKKEVKDESH